MQLMIFWSVIVSLHPSGIPFDDRDARLFKTAGPAARIRRNAPTESSCKIVIFPAWQAEKSPAAVSTKCHIRSRVQRARLLREPREWRDKDVGAPPDLLSFPCTCPGVCSGGRWPVLGHDPAGI